MEIVIDFIMLAVAFIVPAFFIWVILTFKHIAEDIRYMSDRINAIYEIMYSKWKDEENKRK